MAEEIIPQGGETIVNKVVYQALVHSLGRSDAVRKNYQFSAG